MPLETKLKARPLRKHLFVCTNERVEGHPRGCCHARGSEALLKAFKESVHRRGLRIDVRAQRSGCLDACEFGPSVVVYPEGRWYGHVQLEDVEEIIESDLIGNQAVDRLLIPGK